jgi:two-component sensor histidine kinase
MYSLLNLQKRRNNDEELKETLSSVQNRIQTMALVHQNLYNSGEFEQVDVTQYIKNLVIHLQSIYKIDTQIVNIEFDIQTSLSLNIDKIIPVGLLINEAVSNAFKHGFNNVKNGILQINIEHINDKLIIEIIDNGHGFKEEDIKETSIGMQLIKIMCTQLNAVYQLSHTQGVHHKIEFKI